MKRRRCEGFDGAYCHARDAPGVLAGYHLATVIVTAAIGLGMRRYFRIIIAVMFAQFLQEPDGHDAFTVLAITSVLTLNNLAAFLVWTLAASALTALFTVNGPNGSLITFAVTLAGVAIWMVMALFV